MFRSWGIDCKLVTPEEITKLCPLVRTDDIKGGIWIPGDGVGDPLQICQSLVKVAQEGGQCETLQIIFVVV